MSKPSGADHSISLSVTETGLSMGKLAANLQRASRGGLTREMSRALSAAGIPLKAAAKRGALETLPKKGGLAALVAGSRFATSSGIRGTTIWVKLTASSRHDLEAMDRGRLRHPVYGNRKVWVNQRVEPHWFTRYEAVGEAATRVLLDKAMQRVAKSVVNK